VSRVKWEKRNKRDCRGKEKFERGLSGKRGLSEIEEGNVNPNDG
jgi:hypothetical protein